jgi:hypothetical protein
MSVFPGCMMGKVFCLYLILLLLGITMALYGFLSRMNGKQLISFAQIDLGLLCLSFTAALYHFCNYAHCFSNIVRLH